MIEVNTGHKFPLWEDAAGEFTPPFGKGGLGGIFR